MKGKTAVVTGASSGVGLESADALAQKGAFLVLIARDIKRGQVAIERISRNGPKPHLILADLSLQADVRRAAGEIRALLPRIDVLINNAGAWFETRQVTAEGLERTFALNHMGYFLLTYLLLDRIIASAPARIISVSSDGHVEVTLDFDDLQSEKDYSGRMAYCRSKLANILFTRALSRRLRDTGVTANCLHPGRVYTRFFENLILSKDERDAAMKKMNYGSPAEGARTLIYLACSPEVESISGEYFDNCAEVQPSSAALDEIAAERLWTESLRISGLPEICLNPSTLCRRER